MGWISWALLAVGIGLILRNEPDRRGVSHVYEAAAQHWIQAEPLYDDGYKGFLYAPQSAMTYVPFLYPEPVLGSFLWRLVGILLLSTGLMRWARLCSVDPHAKRFVIATWLTIPIAISSIRNGQSNPHLIGALLHGAAAWATAQRARAAGWMIAGLLAKPLAVVPALLAGAADRRLIVPLLIALAVFVALPLAHGQPAFAWDQMQAFGTKLLRASEPGEHVYSNLEGIFHKLGHPIPVPWRRPIQLGAALLTLGAALWAWRRTRGSSRHFAVLSLAVLYLMLFNPRNEANSYVLLAPIVGLLGAIAWTDPARRGEAIFLTLIAVALGCDNYGRWLHAPTDRWLKPLVTIVFAGYLLHRIKRAPIRPLLPLRAVSAAAPDTMPA